MIVAHLIMHVLMKVIRYGSPINLLSVSFPSIKLQTGLAAQVFGCADFERQESGKLDSRAVQRVFVGYSNTQKRYRCYHPTSWNSLSRHMLSLLKYKCSLELINCQEMLMLLRWYGISIPKSPCE